ncbi:MAG TPA: hypothetical protein DCR74_11195 [Achromobacter sp.]|nr:hypothetical protein [Achromobacter sp.]
MIGGTTARAAIPRRKTLLRMFRFAGRVTQPLAGLSAVQTHRIEIHAGAAWFVTLALFAAERRPSKRPRQKS